MKQTSNYQLNQWEMTDRIQMEDFNADNAKVDAALTEEKAAQEALTAAVAKCGNCSVVCTSYVGNGSYGSEAPCTLFFDGAPALVLVQDPDGFVLPIFPGRNIASVVYATSYAVNLVVRNEYSISWYHETSQRAQFNELNKLYFVVAFIAAN